MSTVDYYLDATTMLPVAVTFNMHPDNTAIANMLVEIDFSNYQVGGGVNVPLHIQKFVQGALTLDVILSSAVFNSGVSISNFKIN